MRSFFFFLTFFTIIHTSKSQPLIELHQADTLFFIGAHCAIQSNEPQPVTINDIIQNTTFKPNLNEHVLLGGSKPKNIWLKFSVNSKKTEQAYLELLFPLIDKATLYTVENNNVIDIQEAGQNTPLEARVLHTNNSTFKLQKSEATTVTYYLNVNAKWICNIKPRIGTYSSIIKNRHYTDLIQGLFYGIILVLILYNFFIYLKLKDNVYILYSLYLFCVSTFIVRHEGLTVEFIFNKHPALNDYTLVLPGLAGIFGMLFTTNFLNTRKKLPIIHKTLKAILGLYMLSLLAAFAGYFEFSLLSAHLIMPLSTIVIVLAAIIIWLRGNPTAKYYLLGWASLTVGITIFLLENSGRLPHTNLTAHALHLGVAMEAIILSYAIAHRFGLIKQEQEKMQAEMLDMFKKNQNLEREQNRLLEQKVEERTKELQALIQEGIVKDEQLQEYAAQLENSNRELTEFAHIASHDLKAPMRSIISFAQLFERRNKAKFDDTDREYFNYIKSNAAQSSKLIDDLLNYSKIDKNLGEPSKVDINNCLVVATMNIQSLIREKKAVIHYHNLPTLRGHSSLITQLFQNLINNGIKYNTSEQPSIEIGVQRNELQECVFSISDNGIGIAPENFDKIFSMFRRLHSQAEYDGTGIGLAFCMRIVETYGGKIWVESIVGVGTTFYFTLPKAKMPALELVP
jgi:two-component system, NtrC family, sensor kinase